MDLFIAFLVGFWIGALIGVLLMCLCAVSREKEDYEERTSNRDS